jgi:hypothetical protein
MTSFFSHYVSMNPQHAFMAYTHYNLFETQSWGSLHLHPFLTNTQQPPVRKKKKRIFYQLTK